jgi:catechol 2,3-dioxygenase-like lactoylglutathione lyase family enzyme
MFSHVMVGTNDLAKSKEFYDKLMGTLGVGPSFVDGHRMFYMGPKGVFCVSEPIDGQPACHANGGTIGFACDTPDQVKAWHDTGVEAGGVSIEDPPGVREGSVGKLYLAYLRDPDGNKLCAMHRLPA